MSEISFGDMVCLFGVLGVAGLRVYAGWLCIPESMPKAWRTGVRGRRAQPDEKPLPRLQGGRHENRAAASDGAPAFPRVSGGQAYASFEIQPQ